LTLQVILISLDLIVQVFGASSRLSLLTVPRPTSEVDEVNIALTGGTGFVGSHILTDLVPHGHEVTADKRPVVPASPWLEGADESARADPSIR
jgi:hypothetical protein